MNTNFYEANLDKYVTITDVAKMVAMKSLKTAYANSGLMMYYPNPTSEAYDEFYSIAVLSMVETFNAPSTFAHNLRNIKGEYQFYHDSNGDNWHAVTIPAYVAINRYIATLRADSKKHLYSIDDVDNNGAEIVSDVTVSVQHTTFELARTLRHNLTSSEWKVLKYIVLGYTTETIRARMGYKTINSTIRKMETTRKAAAAILKNEYGIDRAISSRTKSRRRKSARSDSNIK